MLGWSATFPAIDLGSQPFGLGFGHPTQSTSVFMWHGHLGTWCDLGITDRAVPDWYPGGVVWVQIGQVHQTCVPRLGFAIGTGVQGVPNDWEF